MPGGKDDTSGEVEVKERYELGFRGPSEKEGGRGVGQHVLK